MHFPRFRVFTWIILAINLIFLIWIITGSASSGSTTAKSCAGETGQALQTCQDAGHIGTAIGVGLIIALWVAADVILGILWLVTRRKGRDCPVCGNSVKRGQTQCRKCGHDFALAAQGQGYPQGPPQSPVR